jgi:hypothetical protein
MKYGGTFLRNGVSAVLASQEVVAKVFAAALCHDDRRE